MKRVTLLGSTGSIGTNTLAVFDMLPERFEVVGLSAGSNVDLLCEQAMRLRPRRVCVGERAAEARSRLSPLGIEVLNGSDGLVDLASDPEADLVVNGLVAGSGLRPTLAAVESGKQLFV